MTINKETKISWYAMGKRVRVRPAVKVGDTIYLSGQVSHDDKGKIVGPGELNSLLHNIIGKSGLN
jgi:enamine deaminase RidA (YjgF/YER057c/UK114 family)